VLDRGSPDRRVAALAARQCGAIWYPQALAAGLPQRQIDGPGRSATWSSPARRVLRADRPALHGLAPPGVVRSDHVVPDTPDTWQRRASVAQL
jgi:hypothetical protein